MHVAGGRVFTKVDKLRSSHDTLHACSLHNNQCTTAQKRRAIERASSPIRSFIFLSSRDCTTPSLVTIPAIPAAKLNLSKLTQCLSFTRGHAHFPLRPDG